MDDVCLFNFEKDTVVGYELYCRPTYLKLTKKIQKKVLDLVNSNFYSLKSQAIGLPRAKERCFIGIHSEISDLPII